MNPEQGVNPLKKGLEAAQEIGQMYDRIQHLSAKLFKRKCGVKRETFNKMVEVLRPKLTRKGKRGGQGKFGVEDQLLIAMEYWREYRTVLLNSLRRETLLQD